MVWWPLLTSVVLIVFWVVFIFVFGEVFNMILHSYGISYGKKNRIIAAIIGKTVDVLIVASILFVIGTALFYIQFFYNVIEW